MMQLLTQKDVEKMWHRRATEHCASKKYQAETKKDNWVFNTYTILPPLFFKTKGATP